MPRCSLQFMCLIACYGAVVSGGISEPVIGLLPAPFAREDFTSL